MFMYNTNFMEISHHLACYFQISLKVFRKVKIVKYLLLFPVVICLYHLLFTLKGKAYNQSDS